MGMTTTRARALGHLIMLLATVAVAVSVGHR
jgi:hypothetical protein